MPASSSSLSVLAPGDRGRCVAAGTAVSDGIHPAGSSAQSRSGSAPPGRRHGLQSVLLAVQAVMAGAGSWVAIAQWAATAPQALGVCGAPPSASTFRRVLAAGYRRVEAALTRWAIGRQAR